MTRAWYLQHRTELLARQKAYAQANREAIREYQKKYRALHHEELAEKKRDYIRRTWGPARSTKIRDVVQKLASIINALPEDRRAHVVRRIFVTFQQRGGKVWSGVLHHAWFDYNYLSVYIAA